MNERPTATAHRVVREVIRPGDVAIDATAGNGHDTRFLAELVGEGGKVIAFDVQEAAVESTRRRLADHNLLDRVDLLCETHGMLLERAGGETVSVVMFNLGYLPGADHGVITRTTETLKAIEQATRALRPGGVMTVVCYPGHAGGDDEAAAVVAWARTNDGEVFPQAKDDAPFLVVWRKGDPAAG